MLTQEERICKTCKKTLNISEFYSFRKNGKNYIRSYCKACHKNKVLRNRHKEETFDPILEFSLYLRQFGISLLKIVREINEEREGYAMRSAMS